MSLRIAAAQLGVEGVFSWLLALGSSPPGSLRHVLSAAADPEVGRWRVVHKTSVSNQRFSHEINGLVTDGTRWFASANTERRSEGVYELTRGMDVVRHIAPPFDRSAVHIGALALRNGRLYVPLQDAVTGVWVIDVATMSGQVATASELPHDDMFAWCDINPGNGLLYTSDFSGPRRLDAYELRANALVRRPIADIPLQHNADHATTRVQGGCFAPGRKWIASVDVDGAERLHVHSALTGHYMGGRWLRATDGETTSLLDVLGFESSRNELQGVWYHPMEVGGRLSHLHGLELNNDELTRDDFTLWHIQLPEVLH